MTGDVTKPTPNLEEYHRLLTHRSDLEDKEAALEKRIFSLEGGDSGLLSEWENVKRDRLEVAREVGAAWQVLTVDERKVEAQEYSNADAHS